VEQRLPAETEGDGQDRREEEDEELEGAEEHRSGGPRLTREPILHEATALEPGEATLFGVLHAAKPISSSRDIRKSIERRDAGGNSQRRRRSKWGPLWATTA
jgi:hypothetical protein